MHLNIESDNFEPKNFVILNFYKKDFCFAWNDNEFIYFPYKYENSTQKLKVFKAPGKIKDIRNCSEKVFILCHPNGIHMLTSSFELAILSKTGVELGSDFCEVLAQDNGVIVLEDKKLKSTKDLFVVSPTSDVHVLTLNDDTTSKYLRRAILLENYADNVNLCIISHEKNLFKMFDQSVYIIYTGDYFIKSIKPVEKYGKTVGVILQTDGNVLIFMYVVEKKVRYEKIFFHTNVNIVCATMDTNVENTLFLIHSDGQKTFYTKKLFGEISNQDTRTEEKNYESFIFYKSNYIIYLNNSKELIQVSIELLKTLYTQNENNYVKLEPSMMKGLDKIIETICVKSMEFSKITEQVVEKEDGLKRINLFVTKQYLRYCPKESVRRLWNQIFLVTDFNRVLPKNSTVVKMLKSRGKTIFSMKHVKDCDTIVEMPVCIQNLSSKLYTTTDLISHKNDGKIWCLVKNYIRDPLPSKKKNVKLTPEAVDFLKYKLVVLQNLIQENNVTMEALVKLKREVRQGVDLAL